MVLITQKFSFWLVVQSYLFGMDVRGIYYTWSSVKSIYKSLVNRWDPIGFRFSWTCLARVSRGLNLFRNKLLRRVLKVVGVASKAMKKSTMTMRLLFLLMIECFLHQVKGRQCSTTGTKILTKKRRSRRTLRVREILTKQSNEKEFSESACFSRDNRKRIPWVLEMSIKQRM